MGAVLLLLEVGGELDPIGLENELLRRMVSGSPLVWHINV